MKKDSNQGKHLLLKNLLYMLAASLLILIIAFALLKLYARQGQEYELPDVVGLNLQQVQEDNPLELRFVVVDSVYRPGEAGGIIIVQTPKGGTMIKKTRQIYLTVTADSPHNVPVPDLSDLTLRQAVSLLERSNLQVGRIEYVESPYNVILNASYAGQQLTKGSEVPMGSRVDLTMGMGDKVTYSVVPFVLGKTSAKARNDIFRASLNVGQEHFGGVKDKQTAVVVRQEPEYTGVSRYPLGTTVDLWYQDANTIDVDKMVRDFKVDSSKIIYPEHEEEEPATGSHLDW